MICQNNLSWSNMLFSSTPQSSTLRAMTERLPVSMKTSKISVLLRNNPNLKTQFLTGHSQGTDATFLTLPQVSGVGGHSSGAKIYLMNRHLLCLTLLNHAIHCFRHNVKKSRMINVLVLQISDNFVLASKTVYTECYTKIVTLKCSSKLISNSV